MTVLYLSKYQWIVWLSGLVFIASGDDVKLGAEEQKRLFTIKTQECLSYLTQPQHNISEYFCPRTWDGITCWKDAPPGTSVSKPCPSYINGFKTHENATRECQQNGTWHDGPTPESNTFLGWTNYTMCQSAHESRPPMNDQTGYAVANIMKRHLEAFQMMYNVGYAVSLVSLTVAVLIMTMFRKLHCARNYIHLNLFISFLLRAAMNIIRENLWVHNLGFSKDVHVTENGTVTFAEGSHWECRMFFTIYQYVLMASYLWIFIEAFYLHILIFVTVFTEKASVAWYMLLGWTLPLPFVISWAIARSLTDNTLCWNTSTNSVGLTWINKTPVMISILLNFCFFVNIIRLLFTKLNSFPCPDANRNRYKKLARSILVLIPIFGVYDIVFTFPMDNLEPTASFVMLFIEMFFNSYQGVFIAILLCFINTEVRSEIKKAWSSQKMRRSSTVSKISSMDQRSSGKKSRKRKSAFSKYKVGGKSNTSLSHIIEESVPFTSSPVKTYSVVMNGNAGDVTSSDYNEQVKSDVNGDVELKIKFVNIECKSRDGISRNTTSLDIQTLKNGCAINDSSHILNNNVKHEDHTSHSGDHTSHSDSVNETTFILEGKDDLSL